MSKSKTQSEIEIMREGGALLSRALEAAVKMVKPGVKTNELDAVAEAVIREGGGVPSFLHYRGSAVEPEFPCSLCASVNDEIVHGAASRGVELKEGDIISLDLGCEYKGLFTDMAMTVPVGEVNKPAFDLMKATRQALYDAVDAVKVGGSISDIGHAVEKSVAPHGYGIVRALVGHGVGHAVHEDPRIPNFVDPSSKNVKIVEGMCLALEPMITLGDYQVTTKDDGWTVATADGSLSAHFEVTVVALKSGTEILTPLPEL
ncbi:type I methionyl aminopeptidase [Patescibacteria group bacterium]|nr:type I methionyl aminopeptidase [Patescibacteria group bacterium]MBU1907484.1 type I methionyl aminopeptidase [Patescibacteria group bacterium]